MKNTKAIALNTTWYLLALFLCIFSSTSCTEEDSKQIPENWVTLSESPLTISHEGGKLTREFILADGIDPSYVYVISGDSWCPASVDEGSKLNIVVESSTITENRSAALTLIYDEQHKVELTVTQEAAPPTLVSEIKLPAELNGQTVNMGETFNLNELTTVLPEEASDKTLTFTIIEGSAEIATLTDGILKTGTTPGSVKIEITATDGSGVKANMEVTVGGKLVYDHSGWTVNTNITYANGQNYVTDGTTGKPGDILDGNLKTYLSLIKPGKSMSSGGSTYATPSDHKLSFTVDMTEEKQFNFFQWGHRSSNSYNYLRVWGINIYGSHDGTNFDLIENNIAIDYSQNTSIFDTELRNTSTYRYIKVEYSDWSDKHPTSEGGSTSGSSLQVSAFGIGMKYE